MILILTAVALAAASHDAVVDHRGASLAVRYQPEVATQMKTVGMSVGPRMGNEQCRWTAEVNVIREVRDAAGRITFGKRLQQAPHRITGQQPGACGAAKGAIETAIARRTDAVRDHVRQVAERDRPALLAEIDAAGALALN